MDQEELVKQVDKIITLKKAMEKSKSPMFKRDTNVCLQKLFKKLVRYCKSQNIDYTIIKEVIRNGCN